MSSGPSPRGSSSPGSGSPQESLTIYPNLEHALISPGIASPDWRQPERPIRATWPRHLTNIRIDSHQWATNVLEPLQRPHFLFAQTKNERSPVRHEH